MKHNPRAKKAKRGLLAVAGASRYIMQDLSVDEFRELPARKRDARRTAEKLGHDLGAWHRRPNDPYGRWNAFCHTCNMIAIVAVEVPDCLAEPIYGHAVVRKCVAR